MDGTGSNDSQHYENMSNNSQSGESIDLTVTDDYIFPESHLEHDLDITEDKYPLLKLIETASDIKMEENNETIGDVSSSGFVDKLSEFENDFSSSYIADADIKDPVVSGSECVEKECFPFPLDVANNETVIEDNAKTGLSLTIVNQNSVQRRRKGLLNRLINKSKRSITNVPSEKKCHDVLNYTSDVDSDTDVPKVGSLWDSADIDSSDAESVDMEQIDPLQHATVFTEEEAVLAMRNKLLRLQNLYVKEYRKIISTMKEKQREYSTILKKEKEIYGPLQKPSKLTDKERNKYYKLKALSQYHKLGTGPETLLFKKMLERKKAATPSIHSRARIFNKCVYTEGGMRCSVKVIPGSKYCMKHILRDTHQVLFRPCGAQREDSTCEEPVDLIYQDARCILHRYIPLSFPEKDSNDSS